MVAIAIRNVPEGVRDLLTSRAERHGSSLQEFVRLELQRLASMPTVNEWLEEARGALQRTGTRLTAAEILAARDADRK